MFFYHIRRTTLRFVAVISLSMSTKIVLFVDRKPNLLVVSTEIPLFVDRDIKLAVVSTRTHLSVDGT